jgi:hypothetical protein
MQLDAGFRQGREGLVVPFNLERKIKKWTPEQWKLLNRCAKMLNADGLAMPIVCESPECKGVQLIPRRLQDGSLQLQCNCTTRILAKVLGSRKNKLWLRRR